MSDIQKDAIVREEHMKEAAEYLRPHFIFNCLTTIQQLCYENPEKAEETVGDFASYLRGRIDTLKSGKTVSFERELLQLKHYVNLEKLRWEDRVKFVFDIGYADFTVPSMTIVSIVENAVSHATDSKLSECNIYVSTIQKDNCAVISIKSNSIYDDMLSETAVNRLKKQPDTDIHTETDEEGTTVTITIRQQ